MEDCVTIAKELVAHLKRTGVEKVVRRVSRSHGMLKPRGIRVAPAGLFLIRARWYFEAALVGRIR
jgi:hypothetical protein